MAANLNVITCYRILPNSRNKECKTEKLQMCCSLWFQSLLDTLKSTHGCPPVSQESRACVLSLSVTSNSSDPWTVARQAPLSMGFSRQEHWSRLPFPPPTHESETWKWSHSVVSDSCDPMDCSLPGSSIHGIFQARILEWVAISFLRGSSQPRDQTQLSCIAGRLL